MYRDIIGDKTFSCLRTAKYKVLWNLPFPHSLDCGSLVHVTIAGDESKVIFGGCEEERELRVQLTIIAKTETAANGIQADFHRRLLNEVYFKNKIHFESAAIDPDYLAEPLTVLTTTYKVTVTINSITLELVE